MGPVTPRKEELDRLVALYERELAHFQKDTSAAEKMAGVKPDQASTKDTAQLAAWTVAANVLLNLDEAITKG